MANTNIIYWAENQVEADLICGLLKESDIPCSQLKESIGRALGVQIGILGQIAIAVPEDRVAEAEAILLDMDAPAGS
jgi:hypothetical protein